MMGGPGRGNGSGECLGGEGGGRWEEWAVLEGGESACEALEVAGSGREEVLEVALGVAAVAMAAQAVGTDELREGGFDAGTGLQLLAEGRCLGLATAGDQAVVVLGDAQVAAA